MGQLSGNRVFYQPPTEHVACAIMPDLLRLNKQRPALLLSL